jgi:hypothetical protein
LVNETRAVFIVQDASLYPLGVNDINSPIILREAQNGAIGYLHQRPTALPFL